MNGTPRLGSSYPSTPENVQNRAESKTTPGNTGSSSRKSLPSVPQADETSSSTNVPLIPLTLIDAPSQRFYVFAIYVGLLAWRLYDWGKLVEDEADSFWLFIKWVATDGVFLYGLPEMRIPWLEWSNPVTTGLFLLHACLSGMLMFRVPIPIEAFLAAVVRTMYDRELSISENRVKPANILHNSSIIMGKQIINVLPEGFAILNIEGRSFCVDSSQPSARLPIHLNQTIPNYIQLLRLDFDTNANETIEIKSKELRALTKQAKKRQTTREDGELVLEYTVKKPGVYRLQKVVDDSKLEVQRRVSDTLVVKCPKAAIKPSGLDRCIGDLSNLIIEVDGTPPMKILYSRTINREDQSVHNFQSIQPENLLSPLLGSAGATGTLVSHGEQDLSWGGSHSINVRLNESMTPAGKWLYSIEEVHDAIGNVANFTPRNEDGENGYPRGSSLERLLTVHERPQVRFHNCDSRNPLRVPTGESIKLPIQFGQERDNFQDLGYAVTWKFSPIDKLTPSGDHGDDFVLEDFIVKGPRHQPSIRRPGLYTLTSVSSKFCDGEIKEPASCLLLNPPEPKLTMTAEDIYDNCAGNSIGLLVDLDLIGTPPFVVTYDVIHNMKVIPQKVKIDGLRHQIELKPSNAGHFSYRFTTISDSVYPGSSLSGKLMTLEQDVKPPASARLIKPNDEMIACIEESIHVGVHLQGEAPFTLEYEVVHDGRRYKQKVKDVEGDSYTITTDALTHGGEYTLALASVQDKTGCKVYLKDEVRVNVERQRPKASFGLIDGKRKIMAIEGRETALPLRLEGEGPWRVSYRNLDDPANAVTRVELRKTNDYVKVKQSGVYQIVEVLDRHCPGIIESSASKFEIGWISRPNVKVSDNAGIVLDGQKHWKREVCEGDVDAVEIILEGSPPYHLKYQIRHQPSQGSHSVSSKEIDAALGVTSIAMDTSKAGLYSYTFLELSDDKYKHDSRRKPFAVQQTVNAKPLATFSKPGQSYKYCKEEVSGDEIIPITLHGLPPFYLEVDIKHQSSSRPETVKIANIETNQYEFRIPHRVLSLGTHQVSVRKVRDSRGCQRKTEYGAPHVQVQVFDVPTVYPLESRTDYCVGDRISYTLSGTPPFEIYYTFRGAQMKAKSPSTNFRRIAEKPGAFTITAISDRASECKASVESTKMIHEMPSVKLSKGRQIQVDIHEGGQAEILFEFWGTPPFEFTYTRSTNAKKGHKSQVLETKHDISYEHSKIIQSSQEGTYEVVAIKDKFCAFSTQRVEAKSGQKLLQI